MTREESLGLLSSERTIDRLRAARALTRLAQPQDIDVLRQAKVAELDALVRSVLERAIARVTPGNEAAKNDSGAVLTSEDPDLADLYAQATEDVTKMVLHELRPIVGRLDMSASREVVDYVGSETDRAITRIRSLIDALAKLRDASAVPSQDEFDLTDFVRVTAREAGLNKCPILFARDDPVVVKGDPDLVGLALINALRNASEALKEAGLQTPLVVNWGTTNKDAWISVLDEGIGLPEGATKIWEAGITLKSKDVHDGFGLTIARRAMLSLEGSIELRPRLPRGTACDIRWPLRGENGSGTSG